MDSHPNVAIAGSPLEDPDGTPQQSAFRFHTLASEFDFGWRLGLISKLLARWALAPPVPQETCQTDWVAGASAIVRHQVFEAVGFLDEPYFMYDEEMDFCLQANKAGWSCWYVPESRVVHLVGPSSGINNFKPRTKRLPQYWYDYLCRYFVKNYGWLYLVIHSISRFILGFRFDFLENAAGSSAQAGYLSPNMLRDFMFKSVFFEGD